MTLSIVIGLAAPITSFAYVSELEAPGTRTNDCYQPGQAGEVLAQGLPFATQFAPRGRGVTVRGQIEPTGTAVYEADCFYFHASVGDRITANLISESGAASFDPALELWDSIGTYPSIEQSDDDGPGHAAALTYTATSTGLWKVRVRGSTTSDGFKYMLVLAASRAVDPDIDEGSAYNDTQAAAEILPTPGPGSTDLEAQAPGAVAVKDGALADANDVDVYRAQVPSSRWVSAAVYDEYGGLREDLQLTVVAGDATYSDDDSGPFTQPLVTTGRVGGTVYFEVRHAPRVGELDWLGLRDGAAYQLVVAFKKVPPPACGMFGLEPLLLLAPWMWRRRPRGRSRSRLLPLILALLALLAAPPSQAAETYDGDVWTFLIGDYAFERSPLGPVCVVPAWSLAAQRVREYGHSELCYPRWERQNGGIVELLGSLTVYRGSPSTLVLDLIAPTGETWTSAMIEYSPGAWTWIDRLDELNLPWALVDLVTPMRSRAQLLGVTGHLVILPDGPEKRDGSSCSAPVRRFPLRARFILP